MKYFVQIFVYSVLQHLSFIGTVTIDFNSIGYIGESIVLQCQDTPPINATSANWFKGGTLIPISSSRYTHTKTPTGFNLTISSLVTADGGVYHCGIAFGTSAKKSLTIYYNTKDINITQLYPRAIEITFIAFPYPDYKATVKQDGVQLDVTWNVSKSTQASGVIQVSLLNSTAFTNQDKIYTVHVKIKSPVSLDVEKNITWVSDLTTESFSDLTTQKTDDSALESFLVLALGVGLGNGVKCVISLIFIVILVKRVNIQAKDEFQEPILEGSEVTITASVHGFCISGVQWIGPHENILTSDGKYNINYHKKTGISTLHISALAVNDSGLYSCHAKGACGSSSQDSVRITVYETLAVGIDIGEPLRQHDSDVKIICSVYGSEMKSVDWTGQEENILTNGLRYTIAPYDGSTKKSSLIIRNSSMNDAEGYICQVAFIESEVSVKIYITLSDNGSLKVSIEKIMFFVPASENERREWTGPQENILTNTGKYIIVPYDSNTKKTHLTIKDFSMNDNGSFTYQAMDSSGTSPKSSITITTNGATDPKTGASELILRFGFSIIFVECIVCYIMFLLTGNPCAPELGLGLVLGLGIPCFGCIVVIVILVKKGSSNLSLELFFGIMGVASMVILTIFRMGDKQCALTLHPGNWIPVFVCIIVIVILFIKSLKPPPAPRQ